VGIGDSVTIDGVPGIHMSHDRATDKINEHIERFWAPSVSSRDLSKHPAPLPSVFIKNDFDDDNLFYDAKGLEDFEIGGGFYNMSSDNNWKAVGGAATETGSAAEQYGVLSLKSVGDAEVAAVISRVYFGYKGAEYPKGIEIAWTIKRINRAKNPEAGGAYIGDIDADGSLGTPAPSPLKASQLYVALTGGGKNGTVRGDIWFAGPKGPVSLGLPFAFSKWTGATPMSVKLAITDSQFQVSFSEKLAQGAVLKGALPKELTAEAFNAFASYQGPMDSGVDFEKVEVKKGLAGIAKR
jgi:hypothetical protein